jgi:hypothetical protein
MRQRSFRDEIVYVDDAPSLKEAKDLAAHHYAYVPQREKFIARQVAAEAVTPPAAAVVEPTRLPAGEPLKWSKAPFEPVAGESPRTSTRGRAARLPQYSIPSETEIKLGNRIKDPEGAFGLAGRREWLPPEVFADGTPGVGRYANRSDQSGRFHPAKLEEWRAMTLAERQALRQREWQAWTDAGKHLGPAPRRAAWSGESAMSVRHEVGGRRQMDAWTIDQADTGWIVSVNGEEVGRAASLPKARALAQEEATKRLGAAPTPRAVAAEAVAAKSIPVRGLANSEFHDLVHRGGDGTDAINDLIDRGVLFLNTGSIRFAPQTVEDIAQMDQVLYSIGYIFDEFDATAGGVWGGFSSKAQGVTTQSALTRVVAAVDDIAASKFGLPRAVGDTWQETNTGLRRRIPGGAPEVVAPPPAAVTPPPVAPPPAAAAAAAGPAFPRAKEVVIRTPFGDFKLEVLGRNRSRLTVTESPAGVKKGPEGLKVGKGKTVRDVDEALVMIDKWAADVNMRRRVSLRALQNVGGDPQAREAIAQIAGRTEVTGFRGFGGQTWADTPMTQVEQDVLFQAAGLNDLAEADALYAWAGRLLDDGLTEDAQIAFMEGRRRQISSQMHRMTPYSYPQDEVTEFQKALRAFDQRRTRDGYASAMTEAYAAQWGPNSKNPRWAEGWRVPGTPQQQGEMFEMLNKLFDVQANPGEFSKFLGWYDKFLNYWKAQAVSTPGFVIRNGLGGSWMSFAFGLMELGSTNKFAGTLFRAIRRGGTEGAVVGVDAMIAELKASGKRTVGVGFGTRVDVNELRAVRRVLESGIVGGGQVVTEVERGVATRLVKEMRNPVTGNPVDVVFNPASAEFAPFRFVRSANEQMETVLRGSLAFDVLQKGGTLDDAAAEVYRLHFNYADLTSGERKARRVIPFWTWQKNVVPVLVESLGKHPYAWGRLQQVKGNLELQSKQENVVPDYFLENMGIRLPWKINGYQSYWIPDLPFRDLNRLLKEPTSITRVIAESAAPPVKLPLEIWAGKQFFADLPFSGRYQQVPHVYDKFPFLMQALELAGKAKKNKRGEWKMRDQDLYMLDGWMPFLSRFRRLLPNEKRYSRRVASTVVSTVFGTQVRINDPYETRNQIIRNNKAFENKLQDITDIELRLR